MNRRRMWLLVPVAAVVAGWLIMRDRGDTVDPRRGRSVPAATERATAAPSADDTPASPDRAARPRRAPPGSLGTEAASGESRAARSGSPAAGPRPTTATGAAPQAADPARPRSATPPATPEASAPDELVDKTGWGDPGVGRQLNKELMPLASECIDQAKARNPRLEGLLVLGMVIAPTDHGRAIIASVTPRAENQIDDPELLECLRESSFALEGLKAPHDFDLTMPIHLDRAK